MKPEVIRTDRLTLLPLRVEHADEMAVVLSDPGLYAIIGGAPDTAQALRARYERWVAGSPDPAESWCNWVIRLRDETCLTGTVQATVTTDDRGAAAEIAWVVGTPWQRRGIATEAVPWPRHLAQEAPLGTHRRRPHPPRPQGLCRRRHRSRTHSHRSMARRRDQVAADDQLIARSRGSGADHASTSSSRPDRSGGVALGYVVLGGQQRSARQAREWSHCRSRSPGAAHAGRRCSGWLHPAGDVVESSSLCSPSGRLPGTRAGPLASARRSAGPRGRRPRTAP
ncbi:hypothetical protein STENM327S_02941 [Streptomyces tendae]